MTDELQAKREFDAMHLLSDLRRYKERTAPIPWVDPRWVERMEAQRDEEMSVEEERANK